MPYIYKIFNFNIGSDIEINLLDSLNITDPTDINISEDKSLYDDMIHFKESNKNYYKTNFNKVIGEHFNFISCRIAAFTNLLLSKRLSNQ